MCLAYQSGSESVRYSPINPCNEISQEVAESFNGATFTKTTLTEDTVMYRVSGGNAGKSWVICIKNISRWRIAITVGFGIKSFLGKYN